MKKKRHTPEQIINELRLADVEPAKGTTVELVYKLLGVSEQTLYRWRNQFSGIKVDDIKRFKKIVADQAIDISILKEVARGNSKPVERAAASHSPQ